MCREDQQISSGSYLPVFTRGIGEVILKGCSRIIRDITCLGLKLRGVAGSSIAYRVLVELAPVSDIITRRNPVTVMP